MSTDTIHWVTGAALQALANQKLRVGDKFTRDQLKLWQPSLGQGGKMKNAIEKLLELGFITSEQVLVSNAFNWQPTYTVTGEGKAAMSGAASGKPLRSGPRGAHSKNRAVGSNTFVAKLWRLMRARKILDAETAASTLVDAEAQDQYSRAVKAARRYFHRWAQTGAVTESRTRTNTQCKRYVLSRDSVDPPVWTPKALARQQQEAV
jgi:hypothetical protein